MTLSALTENIMEHIFNTLGLYSHIHLWKVKLYIVNWSNVITDPFGEYNHLPVFCLKFVFPVFLKIQVQRNEKIPIFNSTDQNLIYK